MRTYTNGDITIKYPDEVCFTGNYNSVIISGATEYQYCSITYSGYTIKVYLNEGSGEAVISSILKHVVSNSRSESATIFVKKQDGTTLFYFTTYVIKGWLPVNDRIYNYGVYHSQGEIIIGGIRMQVSKLRRMRFYPNIVTYVSFFAKPETKIYYDNFITQTRIPSPESTKIVDYKIENASRYNAVHIALTEGTQKIEDIILYKDDSSFGSGNFIRWIDNKGYYNYFMFDKGSKTIEASYGEDVVISTKEINGIQYKVENPISYKKNVKYKCAACNLQKYEFDYVSTIVSAQKAELCISSTSDYWVPIVIEAKEVEDTYKKEIQNIEIEFTIKEIDEIL